jgi:hypothetical protein
VTVFSERGMHRHTSALHWLPGEIQVYQGLLFNVAEAVAPYPPMMVEAVPWAMPYGFGLCMTLEVTKVYGLLLLLEEILSLCRDLNIFLTLIKLLRIHGLN